MPVEHLVYEAFAAPDVKDDRLPPWRENGLKKRANVRDTSTPPLKNGRGLGSDVGIRSFFS
jgi:hypothetical protein